MPIEPGMRCGVYSLRLPEPTHAADLAPRLRAWDIVECLAMQSTPLEALLRPFHDEASSFAWSIYAMDDLVGMWGIVNHGPRTGIIWAVGSPEIEQNAMAFMSASKQWLQEVDDDWDSLMNYCPANRKPVHRWLKWLGFDISEKPQHFNGVPFVRFDRWTRR